MDTTVDWQSIDTVLLDMDGTLLDLHYDSHFWREHLPRHYAAQHGLSLGDARAQLLGRYDAVAGTIDWYCLDYWSQALDLDILALKRSVAHLIALQPRAIEFLVALHHQGKRRVLVTNAHQGSLELKLQHTALGQHLDAIISSHQFRIPKEQPRFWQQLQQTTHFNPQRTLLIDDSLPVLRSARHYGIAHLLAASTPDRRQARQHTAEFAPLHDFADILPGITPGPRT
ncbi:MAG: GMP/IMP nucleotidase [Gammaproteobacteria bacterium]|nr:GMP/IMP nucleotidase [Gammaproteobacteria bacterium]